MSDTISKNKQKKQAQIDEISQKVGKAKAMVFTNYKGMTHKQLETLKKGLKKVDAELAVTKNTLINRALFEKKLVEKEKKGESDFNLPTATLFAYEDIVLPIKELAKSIKATTFPTIKFAIIEGIRMEEKDVLRLSTLPSRDQLIAQVVGGLKSPLFGLHRALNWNLQKFVMTLSAIQKTKTS